MIDKSKIIEEIMNSYSNGDWEQAFYKGEYKHFSNVRERAVFDYNVGNKVEAAVSKAQKDELQTSAREDINLHHNTPKGFLARLQQKFMLKDKDDPEFVNFMCETIGDGINIERAMRQADAYISAFEGSEDIIDKDMCQAFKEAKDFIKENEMLSPYYDLKAHQRLINQYEEAMNKQPQRADEFKKKIAEHNEAIYKFLDKCDENGLDINIAQEYLEDAKANMHQEKLNRERATIKVEPQATSTSQPQSSQPQAESGTQSGGFNGHYKSERKEAAAAAQTQPEPKIEKINLQDLRLEQLKDIDNHMDMQVTLQDIDMILEKKAEAYENNNSQLSMQYDKLAQKLEAKLQAQNEQLEQNRQIQEQLQNAMQETESLSQGRGR